MSSEQQPQGGEGVHVQHDPYDAKSRSKDFVRPLPLSLLYEDDAQRIANIGICW